MIQRGEQMKRASPGDTLKQATHGAVAESLCFRLHRRAAFSSFPLHELKMSAREHLGQDGMGTTLRTTATMNVVKKKGDRRGNALSLQCEKKPTIHSTFPVTTQQMKNSVFIFLHMIWIPLSLSDESYLFSGDFLRMFNGSGVCTFLLL